MAARANRREPTEMVVWIYGNISNPIAVSPAFDWDYQILVNASPVYAPQYNIVGSHDCYPAHELYIGTQRIHEYLPPSSDPYYIAQCLWGFTPINFGPRSGTIY